MGISKVTNAVSSAVRSVSSSVTNVAKAATSTSRAASTDSFDDSNPSPQDVQAKYESLSGDQRSQIYHDYRDGKYEPKSALDEKVLTKIVIHKHIMEDLQQMSDQTAQEMEKVLNRMNS